MDVNRCKCESPAKGLVLKRERYTQRLTEGYNALGGCYSHGLLVKYFAIQFFCLRFAIVLSTYNVVGQVVLFLSFCVLDKEKGYVSFR